MRAGATFVAGLLPSTQIQFDGRTFGGGIETATFNGFVVLPNLAAIVGVLIIVLSAIALSTGRRLRGGWVVVALGAVLVGSLVLADLVTPRKRLIAALIESGFDEAQSLVDQGVYSIETEIGSWVMVAGVFLTLVGAILAFRARRSPRLVGGA